MGIRRGLSGESDEDQSWENSGMSGSEGGFGAPQDARLDLAEAAPINSDQVKFWV